MGAKYYADFIYGIWRNLKMKYYCIKQHDITDCGAACLATISKQNGYKIGITKFVKLQEQINREQMHMES